MSDNFGSMSPYLPNRPKRRRLVLREYIDICIEDGTLRDEAGQSTIV